MVSEEKICYVLILNSPCSSYIGVSADNASGTDTGTNSKYTYPGTICMQSKNFIAQIWRKRVSKVCIKYIVFHFQCSHNMPVGGVLI